MPAMVQLPQIPQLNLSWLDSRTTQVLIGATAAVVVISYVTRNKYKLPPGPRPLPLLGNILAFRKKEIHEVLREWYEKYGPVFVFYAGPMPIIMINEINEMTDAYVKKGSDFSGRPFIYSIDMITDGSRDIAFATHGETWKYQRKVATQALRQYLIGRQLEERVHEVLNHVADALTKHNEPFNPHEYISLCVFNIIHGMCFGHTFNLDDPVFKELLMFFDEVNEGFKDGFLEDFFPPLRLWPTKNFRNVMAINSKFNAYIYDLYAKHKENFDANDVRCYADNIVMVQKQALEENSERAQMLTDTHCGQIMCDVFGAGVDTTRQTLDWIFFVFASRPDIQARAQKELDEVVGNNIPGKEHRAKLVYLEAVMLEALRLFVVAPQGIPHSTMRDTKIGLYDIPANTMVSVNQYEVMVNPKNFEDPLMFKPERFIDESGTRIVLRNPAWIPFSIGQRACLGESLAKLEILYIMAGLLQRFTFTIDPETKWDVAPNLQGMANIVKPYKVTITSR